MTEPFQTPPLSAIGVVRSAQRLHHEAPRQSGLGRGGVGEIHLNQGMQNGLKDLADTSTCKALMQYEYYVDLFNLNKLFFDEALRDHFDDKFVTKIP